ncbi:MAG: isocitrate lyase/phosphoenolpyruvate mutase family protein [Chloroflexi bacterium]|nr:isocitrate lyase/phosphoenolpyruvate mutase family protein [Chloroflexota bacterium]
MALSPEVLTTANAQARRLRELVRAPRILVMPGAYDVLTVRLFTAMGFEAIQGSSGAIAATYGLYDQELLSLERTAALYRTFVEATPLPVNADGEKGFGGPEAMAETVRQFAGAGVAGFNLEDSDYHAPGAPMTLLPLAQQVEKIRAVMAAKAALGSELFLNARVDVFGTVRDYRDGLDEAIRRGNAYAEAGADCIFIFRPPPAEGIRTLVREIQAPLSILATPDSPSPRELEELGVARVSYGAAFLRVAITAVRRLAASMQGDGNPAPLLREAMSHADLQQYLRGPGG